MARPLRPTKPLARLSWAQVCRWLWKVCSGLWVTVIGGLLLNLFASWLITPVGPVFPHTPLGLLLTHPLPSLLGTSVLVFFTGVLWQLKQNLSLREATSGGISSLPAHDRLVVIHRLHQEYDKRIEQSSRGEPLIPLELQERSDVTHSSAQLVFHRSDLVQKRPLPSGTTLLQVYDQAGQGLLLLGSPGSGKTTLLLGLARQLLSRAKDDPTHPVAVILNLSSWADQKLPLDSWLVDQLRLVYGIPSPLGYTLLSHHHWLLLLDGLDEVDASARTACIEAINTFRRAHLVPLVVCSRSQPYLAQAAQLALPGCVEIQPLQPPQVIAYLEQQGQPLEAVRLALVSNSPLQHLLTTPLLLGIVIQTYQQEAFSDLFSLDSQEQQRQIFARYIQRVLNQHGSKRPFSEKQTQLWMIWLAQQMQQQHLTEFYLEELQFTWLPPPWLHILQPTYRSLRIGWSLGIRTALFLGLFCWLLVGPALGSLLGLFGALVTALGAAIFVTKAHIPLHERLHIDLQHNIWEMPTKRWFIGSICTLSGIVAGVLVGMSFGLMNGFLFGVFDLLVFAFVWWLLNAWLRWLLRELDSARLVNLPRIRPYDLLKWSWKGAWLGILVGLLGVFAIGWLDGPFFGLALGIPGGSAIALLMGLSKEQIREDLRLTPNQGIQSSGWNGLGVGIASGISFGMAFGFTFGRLSGLSSGVTFGGLSGLSAGLVVGLLAALAFGGADYLGHYFLRLLLWRSGAMPWRLVRFLEEVTEHGLLQRVGGGYRFIHPLFQDYFASLEIPPSTRSPHAR